MKNFKNLSEGFTYVEAILYIAIISLMLTTLIPFAWNIIEGGAQSSIQEEVSSNARYISERIKYEIRNATGVNSTNCGAVSKTISLSNSNANLNPTVINYDNIGFDVTIKQGLTGLMATPMPLNSNDINITNFSCTQNISSDSKTKNISVGFTVQQANTSSRADFKFSMPVSTSAEVRSN
jgi:Tfp pilus assembly protein FimT